MIVSTVVKPNDVIMEKGGGDGAPGFRGISITIRPQKTDPIPPEQIKGSRRAGAFDLLRFLGLLRIPFPGWSMMTSLQPSRDSI